MEFSLEKEKEEYENILHRRIKNVFFVNVYIYIKNYQTMDKTKPKVAIYMKAFYKMPIQNVIKNRNRNLLRIHLSKHSPQEKVVLQVNKNLKYNDT